MSIILINLLPRQNKKSYFFFPLILMFLVFASSCKKNGDNEENEINISNTLTDPRDGNIYSTVTIGDQLWMAENLRYLPNVFHPWAGTDSHPLYYVYQYYGKETDNGNVTTIPEAKATDNYARYGVLYNWTAALTSCPSGWHLPTDDEWKELIDYLGGDSVAGSKLRNRDLILWEDPYNGPDTTSTNESGFSALPGGRRNPGGSFGGMGMYSYFWSSTDEPDGSNWDGNAWYVVLVNNDNVAYREKYFRKDPGFSVRCLKN